MTASSAAIRLACAMLFAVLLATRSLAPAGFMPAFDHGAVAIELCPDGDAEGLLAGIHHHHDPSGHGVTQHPCPYASASGLAATGVDWAPLLAVTFFVAALLLGRSFLFVERNTRGERPPARGPPIPA